MSELADTANVVEAARAAGIPRQTVYDWRNADPNFALAWIKAIELGTDALEDEAVRRAKDGILEPVYQGGKKVGTIRRFSDTLLIFLMKGRRPAKYRDSIAHRVGGDPDNPTPIPIAREVEIEVPREPVDDGRRDEGQGPPASGAGPGVA